MDNQKKEIADLLQKLYVSCRDCYNNNRKSRVDLREDILEISGDIITLARLLEVKIAD